MINLMCKIVDIIEEFFLKIIEKIGLKKFTEFYRNHKEGMRYLVFGAFTTVVNIVVFEICKNLWDMSTTISNIIAWILAVFFAYITNKWFVFYAKAESIKKLFFELSSFFAARVFTLVVETMFLYATIDYYGLNSILMKIISNILVIILNFILSKLFIFKKTNSDENTDVEKNNKKEDNK